VVAPLFYKRFRSLNMSWPVSKRFTLPMGSAYISGALKKSNLDYHKLKNLEANDG
jgi:hypothetical protein